MATWRPMRGSDLGDVCDIAARVHVAYPESAEVFAERLRLYPRGCFVLGDGAALVGYGISHPWHFRDPPALDTPLGSMPSQPDTYYIHDIALLPSHRGRGGAEQLCGILVAQAVALGLRTVSLIAVNGSAAFWERLGFRIDAAAGLDARLASYDDDARFMVRTLV
jgi:ribosomal protein S18 acetylase RimI-like enzyme